MKYEGTVTSVGNLALQFLHANRMLILFDENVPAAMRDMVVTHAGEKPTQEIRPGDSLTIGRQAYTVADVGESANRTLRENGHCTLVFGENKTTVLPGQIVVQGQLHPRFRCGETLRFE